MVVRHTIITHVGLIKLHALSLLSWLVKQSTMSCFTSQYCTMKSHIAADASFFLLAKRNNRKAHRTWTLIKTQQSMCRVIISSSIHSTNVLKVLVQRSTELTQTTQATACTLAPILMLTRSHVHDIGSSEMSTYPGQVPSALCGLGTRLVAG